MKKLRDILEQQKIIVEPTMKREMEAEASRKSFVNKIKNFFGGGDWNGNKDTLDERRCDGMHWQFARLR